MTIETFEISIPQLGGRKRTVRVLLPPGYGEEQERRYPVLYMQDGHNLFSPETATFGKHWEIGETLDALAVRGDRRRVLVVGVDCNHDRQGMSRLDEYSPWVNPSISLDISRARGFESAGGEGAQYLAFLADTLMPLINQKYRTLPGPASTGIAGSSMGGLFSLYALYERPDLFGLCGAFSTAAWFAKEALMQHIAQNYRADRAVYLDIGTAETSDDSKADFPSRYLQDTLDIRDYLTSRGLAQERLLCVVDKGANHSEQSWARRFPGFINWAFGHLAGAEL
ncbi:MAG: hypothetical protein LDL24_00630 [Treponema sp.]|nr:hypothetical protein [Treponema sp.]